MERPAITQAEINELEQILFDLRAFETICRQHGDRVQRIISKYTATRTDAALKRAEKRKAEKLAEEQRTADYWVKFEIHRCKGRIKYLRANPQPGMEMEIRECEAYLMSKGKLPVPKRK